MDLIKAKAPDAVEVEGVFYEIKTELRDWLAFSRLLKSDKLTYKDIEFLYIYEKPADAEKGFKALLDFYNPPKELPRVSGKGSSVQLIDYDLDADFIYSAFLEQYNIDLLATDENGKLIPMHWHKFLALLSGLHDTKLNEIMGYRGYNENDKSDYKKQMIQLKNAWRIPTKADKESKKVQERFESLLK